MSLHQKQVLCQAQLSSQTTQGNFKGTVCLPAQYSCRPCAVNTQMLYLCRTILDRAMGSGADPVQLDVSVKPFPWPSVKFDPAAIAAAAAFNLLLVFAFLTPTRGAVATIVREKELRLREGMRILGLKVNLLQCYSLMFIFKDAHICQGLHMPGLHALVAEFFMMP